MTCLSKQIFVLYAHKGKPKDFVFRIMNSEIYNNKYVDVNKLPYLGYKRKRSIISWKQDEFILERIKRLPSIIIGHGSLIKAEMFNDYEHFVPQTIIELLILFKDKSLVINNELKEKLLKTYFFENKSRYYLAPKDKIEKFLTVHNGKYLFLTYTQ